MSCVSVADDRHGPPDAKNLAAIDNCSAADFESAIECQALDPEEVQKALDAIIVAIGIVAVLITNVAYVGYLTPPGGGAAAYWADCDYPIFTGYIYLNGFALVFSTAAIAAVTFGPFVLIKTQCKEWRQMVVCVGLWHLAASLLTLLIAFVLAGLVLATINPPDLTCANLKCGEGGIACTLDSNPVNPDTWGFILDQHVVNLNSEFGFKRNVNESTYHMCCNFNFISDGNRPWTGFTQSPDSDDPCFVLCSADYILASNANGMIEPPSVAELVRAGSPRHGRTMWCTNATNASCAWPVDFASAFRVHQSVNPTLAPPVDAQFFQKYGQRYNLRNGEDAFCLAQPDLAQTQYKMLPWRSSKERFVPLLSIGSILQRSNGTYDGTRVLAYPDGADVQAYLQSLSESGPCSDNSPWLSGGCKPLWRWVNYRRTPAIRAHGMAPPAIAPPTAGAVPSSPARPARPQRKNHIVLSTQGSVEDAWRVFYK